MYNPPSVKNETFNTLCVKSFDRITSMFDNSILIGDLNFDLNDPQKGKTLIDICDIFDLTNMIKSDTCFTKYGKPSLVDVLLTNQPQYLFNSFNFDCGLSDCHNMIGILVKGKAPFVPNEKVQYRSFKNFDEKDFNADVQNIPFHISYVFDDPDDVYWAHEYLFKEVVDQHAPMKERRSKTNKPPFMNCELRRAVYVKRMLRNKYMKCRSPSNWENYRKQRNLVTKLKRQSLRGYFFERCHGGPKSKDFWPTIKPFLSKKGSKDDPTILLNENGKIISDQKEVCDVFNDFFVNVAKDIGSNCDNDFTEHPSILKINDQQETTQDQFNFTHTDAEYIQKSISKLQTKKATGVDGISAKILKSCSNTIAQPITNLINFSFDSNIFPNSLKQAQVIPIFKKKDPLDKQNYRPVSILPTISKLYERTIHDQLTEFFDNIFSPFLAAFRKGFGCQTTLLRLIEDWKTSLDQHKSVAAILMDLSKAFDCLPHELLLAKLEAYGLTGGGLSNFLVVTLGIDSNESKLALIPAPGRTSLKVSLRDLYSGHSCSTFL